MRNYISILILIASAAVYTGCNETTVSMDNSVDVRVDSAMKAYKAQLVDADYGWIADIETSKGFYRFWMEFADNDMVTMYTDNLDYPEYNGIPKSSTYKFHAYQRPVLSFDTYNYLHIICDPNNGISGGSGNLGLKTDFEYEIDEVTDDLFTMTGRINRIKATLRRATQDEMQAVRQGALQEVLKNAPSYEPSRFCYIDVNGTAVDLKFSTRNVMLLSQNGENVQIDVCQTHTDLVTKDLIFEEPITINGVEIKGLKYYQETFITDSETPLVVNTKASANVGLYNCLGIDKYYSRMRVRNGMIANADKDTNPLGYYMNNVVNLTFLLTIVPKKIEYVDLSFDTDNDGNAQLTITPTFDFGQSMDYRCQVLFSESGDSFTTIGSTLTMDDLSEGFYSGSSIQTLVDYMMDKTYLIEWTNVTYDVSTMGQLRTVNNGIIYGELSE